MSGGISSCSVALSGFLRNFIAAGTKVSMRNTPTFSSGFSAEPRLLENFLRLRRHARHLLRTKAHPLGQQWRFTDNPERMARMVRVRDLPHAGSRVFACDDDFLHRCIGRGRSHGGDQHQRHGSQSLSHVTGPSLAG